MACAPTNPNGALGLGAALRSCGVCDPAPPARRWILADRLDSSRAQLGQQVQVKLESVPWRDSRGRYAHVRGIFLAARLNITTVDDNAAVTAYMLRAVWGALFLVGIDGWQWLSGVDGRVVMDDQWFREYTMRQFPFLGFGNPAAFPTRTTDAGVPADTTPGVAEYDCSLYFPLVPTRTDGGTNPLQGLIPLATLQRNGLDAFRFTLASTIPGAPTGVTLTSIERYDGTLGLDVWLDVVYLPAIIIDAPWKIDSYLLTETKGVLRYAEMATEYAYVRFFPNDTNGTDPAPANGQQLADGIEGITVQAGGNVVLGGMQNADVLTTTTLFAASDRDSALIANNATGELPHRTGDTPLALALLPMRNRQDCAAGPISYDFATNTGTSVRFAHRVVGCHSESRGASLASKLAFGPCAVYGTNADGTASREVQKYQPAVVVPSGKM